MKIKKYFYVKEEFRPRKNFSKFCLRAGFDVIVLPRFFNSFFHELRRSCLVFGKKSITILVFYENGEYWISVAVDGKEIRMSLIVLLFYKGIANKYISNLL